MDVVIKCPKCGNAALLPPSDLGTRIICPKCNRSFLANPETVGAGLPIEAGLLAQIAKDASRQSATLKNIQVWGSVMGIVTLVGVVLGIFGFFALLRGGA